jgi:hypothetical protein
VRVKGPSFFGYAESICRSTWCYGDVVMPEPKLMPFPSLLGLPAPVVSGVFSGSVVAEKLEAMRRSALATAA